STERTVMEAPAPSMQSWPARSVARRLYRPGGSAPRKRGASPTVTTVYPSHPTPMRRSACLMGLAVALFWSLLPSLPATAQYFGRNKVQYDDFDFQVIRTEHFEIYYYPEEEQAARDAARMAERWYRRHSRTFLREFRER